MAILFLELNEINFESVRRYVQAGFLPVFRAIIGQHRFCRTSSEQEYEELEPWIQWVTAHTGQTLAEHGVFRLGDIERYDIPQIWERLEEEGLLVGAVSPMNAKNRTKRAAFFVPDPWTNTTVTGSGLLKNFYKAVSQAVNDNAQSRLSATSLFWLTSGALANARAANYDEYIRLVTQSRHKPWAKAMFLDLLLADTFINLCKRRQPDFASLFVNAGAHIQHHYMFSSAAYDGPMRNPDWYIPDGVDPVLEIYQLYDRILGQIQRALPHARLMIATGLHQDPHPELTFYWRLKDHAAFLKRLNVPFTHIEPRMSRDFLISCANAVDAEAATHILNLAVGEDGTALFEVDNRGCDLFVMLTYPNDIPNEFIFRVGDTTYEGFRDDVAFVAIKNGQHNGIGYFLDTGTTPGELPEDFPLKDIPHLIFRAFGLKWNLNQDSPSPAKLAV